MCLHSARLNKKEDAKCSSNDTVKATFIQWPHCPKSFFCLRNYRLRCRRKFYSIIETPAILRQDCKTHVQSFFLCEQNMNSSSIKEHKTQTFRACSVNITHVQSFGHKQQKSESSIV